MLPGGLPGPRFRFSEDSSLDVACGWGGARGALNGVVDGVDVKVGGPGGGLLATDDTVEVGGRLTVGGVILLSDFFRFRPEMVKNK